MEVGVCTCISESGNERDWSFLRLLPIHLPALMMKCELNGQEQKGGVLDSLTEGELKKGVNK